MNKLLVILLVILVSCKSDIEKKEGVLDQDLDRLKLELDHLFHKEVGKNEPGAALLVSYDEKMLVGKGYGLRDYESQQPITVTTNLRMASVSKQFTALNILSLADKNLLALEDTVERYLPYPIFKNITIEQLINHTSGLPDYYEHFEKTWDKEKILENKHVLEWLATDPPMVFEPGNGWEYSNTAYLMLALIVEKVSEVEFSKYAKDNIFLNSGMKQSNYFNLANPITIPERAYCYEKDSLGNFKKVDGFYMNGVMGDGAVYTSVQDYFNYDQALRKKEILSKRSHGLIFEPSSSYTRDSIQNFYAKGWFVTDSTASHTGGWYGTNTYVKRYLDRPLTIAIFMNRNTLFENNLVRKTDSLVLNYLKQKSVDVTQ